MGMGMAEPMSADIVLCCLDCRVKAWVAQDGLSGPTIYSGEPGAMAALAALLFYHQGHRLIAGDDQDYEEGYREFVWTPAWKDVP